MAYNQWELEELLEGADRRAPQVARYTAYLRDWFAIVQRHSDGWAYARSLAGAGQVMAGLIEDAVAGRMPSPAEWNRAIGGIKRAAHGQLRHGNKIPVPALRSEDAPEPPP